MQTIMSELKKLEIINLDAGEVFSGKASGTIINGYKVPCSYTPKVDPDYIFHEASRDLIVWFLNPSDPIYAFGPTGCGKTSCIKQLAARLNYPVFEVTGHGRLEFSDLTGHHTVQNGNMSFEYGPLSLAMKYGGLFLLNEIDLTSPDVTAGLNGILDGSPLCIAENGGEIIMPHANFRFAATANTNGGGDETGLYQGTQRQNLAFLDRFMLCELGYPDPIVEENLLNNKFPELPKNLCSTMVSFANDVRKLFMGDDGLEITFSTRSLLRWANLTVRFQPLARQGIKPVSYALDRALGFRATRESRAMLHELAQRMFENIRNEESSDPYTGKDGIHYLNALLAGQSANDRIKLVFRKQVTDGDQIKSKDWIGQVQPNGLDIKFGKTNNVNQSKFVKLEECESNDPVAELRKRASKKLMADYTLIKELSNY